MKKLVILSFIIISFTHFAISQNKQKQFDYFFSALAKNQDFNGNVLIAEKGKIVYRKSFGYADFPSKRLNTPDTQFPVASISKTITATAILQQVESGKIRLDDSVTKYLSDFPYPNITVKNLLSHTSGLPPYNAFFNSIREANPHKIFTNTDFIAGLNANKQPLIYQSGESWNYDNINYIVLALILEKVSGKTYQNYIENHILKPVGMTHTFFFQDTFDSSKNYVKNLVIPHLYERIYSDEPIRADSIKYVSDYWKSYKFSGFGEYVSTTEDLLKYDKALYNGTLLSEKIINEAFTPIKLNNDNINSGNYGLGWTISKFDSFGKIVLHTGGSIGLNCILYRNVTKNQTVIAFDIAHPSAIFIAENALKILNGQMASFPKKNLARIYGKLLIVKEKEVASKELKKLSKDTTNYALDKEDLIRLGYEFLGDVNPFHLEITPQNDKALEVFKQEVDLFPDYWNAYDSYGDALARNGKKEMAIKMYQKSIQLKPDSESGKKALEKLLRGK